jgi:dTDP-4-amino-4,6-dideoxygalactose transaminase
MWIRVFPDIAWSDLFSGFLATVFARDRETVIQRIESRWSSNGDALVCLTVRSALDLLLTALDLPKGSEVLYSAVTIPDMVQVSREHGLVPVPVDLKGADLHLDVEALRRAMSRESRVLVVAHLFGARPDMAATLEVAHEAGLFVIEDCAQAWCDHEYRGDVRADASLFSFGVIKTATALGGALARISDPAVLLRMREQQRVYPTESQRAFAVRILENFLLGVMATRPVFSAMVWLASLRGLTVDGLITGLAKRFPDPNIMPQLRQQPCAAQLHLLDRRLHNYDLQRVKRRIASARLIIDKQRLAETCPELTDSRHTFWLFPYPTDQPQELVERLWAIGVDSARYGSLEVLPAPAGRDDLDCVSARALLDQIVFLPCYPELPKEALRRICAVLSELSTSCSPPSQGIP